MNREKTHLVLIPAFNPGRLLGATVEGALANWSDVWVVVDGSTDGSHDALAAVGKPGMRVIVLPRNGGKGAAVLAGARDALASGFTHALVMDADRQHPEDRIGAFMAASMASPGSVICGKPVFGPEAPLVRRLGRLLSVGIVRMETAGRGPADPLFGFRVYPLAPLVRALGSGRRGRRYNFDPEAAVQLAWAGAPAINLEAPCRYLDRANGGVSHYRYLGDNLRMVAMHARLLLELLAGRRGAPNP
ncbi:MAG: glycosyltransferase family 2 protein [Opitutaceae bacterium]|jgi:glycosyltransferase involved in cell wall biosynthesis